MQRTRGFSTVAKTINKFALAAVAAVSALSMAAPASAVVTTFASFNTIAGGNIVYNNDGTGGSNTTYRSNGTGGTISTTSSAFNVRPANAVPGGVAVSFSFLQPQLASLSNLAATFTLSGTAAPGVVDNMFGFSFMPNFGGSFSFVSTAPITIGSFNFLAGANLLTGTFTQATIVGQTGGTSGSLSGSTPGSVITYTSDFLDFTGTTARDFSMSLTAITSLVSNANSGVNSVAGRSLRSFRATSTGSFSSNPAPAITVVPEPQTWGLMIVGFAMVGATLRRRKTVAA
jgi:hypothetical protein